jgi:hypothetical protein
MECTIRPALDEDSSEISAVILRALRETNAKDYTDQIIERVEHSFSPGAVLEMAMPTLQALRRGEARQQSRQPAADS